MSGMLPVVWAKFSEGVVNAVSGRDPHRFLEVGSRFDDWMRRSIEDFGFIDCQDFEVSLKSEEKSSGRPVKEYTISIPMAKELAMVQRTPKGKQARRHEAPPPGLLPSPSPSS